jgi:hypothetical protein
MSLTVASNHAPGMSVPSSYVEDRMGIGHASELNEDRR